MRPVPPPSIQHGDDIHQSCLPPAHQGGPPDYGFDFGVRVSGGKEASRTAFHHQTSRHFSWCPRRSPSGRGGNCAPAAAGPIIRAPDPETEQCCNIAAPKHWMTVNIRRVERRRWGCRLPITPVFHLQLQGRQDQWRPAGYALQCFRLQNDAGSSRAATTAFQDHCAISRIHPSGTGMTVHSLNTAGSFLADVQPSSATFRCLGPRGCRRPDPTPVVAQFDIPGSRHFSWALQRFEVAVQADIW